MTERATLQISAIAAGGRGVGRVDGMAVFVPRAAPDETLEVALTRHRRYGEGRITRVITPSPQRVAARCRHYDGDRCGGCQLQHLDYPAQLDAKRRIISDALTRIARRTIVVPPVTPSPSPWQYRNKLTLTLRRRGSAWIAGLRPWDAPDEIFALEECPITADAVVAGWRDVMAHAHLLPDAAELRGAVRTMDDTLSFVLQGGSQWKESAAFLAACPGFVSVHWTDDANRTHILREPSVPAAPAAFEQVNPPVSAAVHAHVVSLVRQGGPRRLIDAYAGRGVTAGALIGEVPEIVAIELDAAAARLARHALGSGATIVEGRVEDELAGRLPADVVVLNPPRAGVDARVCAALESSALRPRRIVYVSCDPGTLARDLSRLPSYHLASVQPFDMFPQTAHVETVCELVAAPS
jgi:23S rRNA (uracil1939-C5)-methyltransferase